MTRELIPFDDYQRIYQSIYSIVRCKNLDILRSCLYFSMFGAWILKQHYNIDARPVVGVAAYKVGDSENDILLFADVKDDSLECTPGGFHAWIQADGWLIDFTAPVFPEILKSFNRNISCEPKMLQKELGGRTSSVEGLVNIGDYYLRANPEVNEQLLMAFSSEQDNINLSKTFSEWYQRPPNKMQKDMPISDSNGNVNHVSLCGAPLVGVW